MKRIMETCDFLAKLSWTADLPGPLETARAQNDRHPKSESSAG